MRPTAALAVLDTFRRVPYTVRVMRGTRRRTKTLAALVALFCVGSQASNVLHLLLVRHGVCLQHGELIHEEDTSRAVPLGSDDPAVSGGTDAGEHGDEHCGALGDNRVRAIRPETPAANATSIPAIEAAGAAQAVVLRSLPLFRLAPKNSPPIV